jgi:acetyl esterase/lipase
MPSTIFVIWFGAALLWTVNALRRPVQPGKGIAPPWLPAMLVSELAPWLLLVRVLVVVAFISIGAQESVAGWVALALFILCELGLLVLIGRTLASARATGHSPSAWSLFRIWDRLPAGVTVTPEVPYWDALTLDMYRSPDSTMAPALIYAHPGSWMRGRPGRQARAMFHLLAASGWVVLDIRYPLSPEATFPDHLIGVKHAIAWAKTGGSEYGIDPNLVAISGASSGAHLAALAALTWDRTELQPGFEDADTSVIGCVPFYGIYDLLVRNPTRFDWPFIARYVLKADKHEAPDLYRLGSPIDQARTDAPPFLVIHGEYDSVVLAEESRHFVAALERVGVRVEYHEILGGQHGFDAVASLRSRAVGRLAAEWLGRIVSEVPNRHPPLAATLNKWEQSSAAVSQAGGDPPPSA